MLLVIFLRAVISIQSCACVACCMLFECLPGHGGQLESSAVPNDGYGDDDGLEESGDEGIDAAGNNLDQYITTGRLQVTLAPDGKGRQAYIVTPPEVSPGSQPVS